MKRVHEMPFGARLLPDGGARFRLWAPDARTVALVRRTGADAGEQPMRALPDGWFELTVPRADRSTRYAFRIDGDAVVPDPASRANPDDVHAASALTDPLAFDWPDAAWRGRPWHEAVIYELHVGCFTPQGTFAAAIERLDDLVDLGITAIELMPVADFAGGRGWGYDGVLPFAPEASYGTPDDLKRLVAAAHARGLMVLLDVVCNHFGPEGNYLHRYASSFFDDSAHTPWGAAIRFEGRRGRTVRRFFVHNALYWVEEFGFDGLRLDAVHAMRDGSRVFIADAIARALRRGPGRERRVHVVLENDRNDAARLIRHGSGRPRAATAQWNDDVHHALHVMVSGERDGYYADYADAPVQRLGRALAEGFAYQGDASPSRGGESRGTPSTQLPPLAFVDATQTHDQVGNRAFGERLCELAQRAQRSDALGALLACVLLAPAVPMLFMGEEFAASTPFLYFCDFHGDLARAVTNGRRSEFARFAAFADPAARERIPDPNDDGTFRQSKLNWAERAREPHRAWLALYRTLLTLRRQHLVPWLAGARSGRFSIEGGHLLRVQWPLGAARTWHLLANLCDAAAPLAVSLPGDPVYDSAPGAAPATRPPWSVQVALEQP
jgi:malto-oligosyltrehalose trehalohydrolase